MADFVAVIRRAVDGLAKNTPDMRAKVYDKARGAVRRQLENMKPTPTEDLIRRQMDKLEAAIESVEVEHAEALPAEEQLAAPVAAVPDIVEQYPALEPEQPAAAAGEWRQDEVEPSQPDADHGYREPGPSEDVRSYEHGVEQQPEPAYSAHDEHYDQPVGAAEEAWVAPEHQPSEEPRYHDEVAGQVEHNEPLQTEAIASDRIAVWPESETYQPSQDVSYEGEAAGAVEHRDEVPDHGAAQEQPVSHGDGVQSWHPEEQSPAPTEDWSWPPEEQAPKGADMAWRDVPDLGSPQGETVEIPYLQSPSESVEAHFHEQTHASADSVRMPAVTELPDLAPSTDYRADATGAASQAKPASKENDPWSDLEELIGYNQDALPAGDAPAGGADSDGEMLSPPPRAYRVAPKKRNYAGPVLALIGLLIIAGGGYALWINRDSLTDLGGGSDPVAPVTAPAAGNGAAGSGAADAEPPAIAQQTPPAAETAPGQPTTPPVDDGVAADAKFTQRLLADGTEVDDGPGPTGATGEGQSVAQLNAPPATPGEAGAAEAEAGAAEQAPAEPSATPDDAAALSGEKMFLYEERLGQTAPTAIEGAVSWSLLREPGENGVQEPVVQGRLNVPGRGLTALLTFKRNTDASLPASHLVEIVFAVPEGFEGGTIDSVQRIAMKQTEQDRGDALIAVPAKITDDFHMIALNDFPDARATNLELLRSRNWMDIPLAYRNGRRALLTMQKGEAGTQAFNEAIQEWTALNSGSVPAPTGQ